MRWLVLAAAAVLVGCQAAVPRPDVAMAAASGQDLATLARGREVYVTSCTGCHQLYRIDAYDRDGWKDAVASMAPRAKLDQPRRDALLAYLLAAAR